MAEQDEVLFASGQLLQIIILETARVCFTWFGPMDLKQAGHAGEIAFPPRTCGRASYRRRRATVGLPFRSALLFERWLPTVGAAGIHGRGLLRRPGARFAQAVVPGSRAPLATHQSSDQPAGPPTRRPPQLRQRGCAAPVFGVDK